MAAADPASSPQGAFNQALRQLGVDRGEAFDEFDALNLGKHRHTEDCIQPDRGALSWLNSG
jgi:hypothetical protein